MILPPSLTDEQMRKLAREWRQSGEEVEFFTCGPWCGPGNARKLDKASTVVLHLPNDPTNLPARPRYGRVGDKWLLFTDSERAEYVKNNHVTWTCGLEYLNSRGYGAKCTDECMRRQRKIQLMICRNTSLSAETKETPIVRRLFGIRILNFAFDKMSKLIKSSIYTIFGFKNAHNSD